MNKLAILVLSCDKYAGLWDLFFSRWSKYWPDCEHDVYLLSNQKRLVNAKIKSICTGEDKDWSSNLLYAIEHIEASNILLMIEDAPLNKKVESHEFNFIYARFCQENMNYLNLKADPLPCKAGDSQIGIVPQGALYRTALVPSIWNKKILQTLLVPGETAWQFEIRGSERSDKFDGFYSLRQKFFIWVHCVIQGKLDLRAVAQLRKSGEIDMVQFPKMSKIEFIACILKEVRGKIFQTIIPFRWKRKVRSIYYSTMFKKSKLI